MFGKRKEVATKVKGLYREGFTLKQICELLDISINECRKIVFS